MEHGTWTWKAQQYKAQRSFGAIFDSPVLVHTNSNPSVITPSIKLVKGSQKFFQLQTCFVYIYGISLIRYAKVLLLKCIACAFHRCTSTYKCWASIKPGTWNIPEHSGTFQNIPEHGIIIIIMRKICKIKFSTTKWNKIELVSAWKIKEKKNRTKQNKNITKQIQTVCIEWRLATH